MSEQRLKSVRATILRKDVEYIIYIPVPMDLGSGELNT